MLSTLSAAIRHASRTIVFTESIQAATDAAAVLAVQGIRAKAMHSKMDMPQRRDVLAAFSRGNLQVITAPKILDEGIDVPEADLGIILAASKSRRQMVQRMGRVLRRKQDGRLARFVIIFVRDTNEDPEMGTHESFLEEITDPAVADDVRVFESWKPGEDVVSYVNDFYC